jgi:hypothetical protein
MVIKLKGVNIMLGKTFRLVKKDESLFEWETITPIERVLDYTDSFGFVREENAKKITRVTYHYILICIADGELVYILQEELFDNLICGFYELVKE